MQKVSTEELITHKILPYNIYSEFGEKIFAAGEVLTPGKLLQLKHMDMLYRDDSSQSTPTGKETKTASTQTDTKPTAKPAEKAVAPQVEPQTEPQATPQAEPEEDEEPISKIVVETFDMSAPTYMKGEDLKVDDIDILNYKGPINKKAKIDPQTQIKIKAFYNKILDMIDGHSPVEALGMFVSVRDKIVQDIVFGTEDISFCSQLKLLGEYQKCHALNVAILSGALAKRMDLDENTIVDVVMAALLHDIGKTRIDEAILNKFNPTPKEHQILQSHTQIGYKILKKEMDLPENIAKVALEHHEHNDGSGYPNGASGDRIRPESRIVSVCNYFDNLTFNRTTNKVRNTKDALRVLLEQGSKQFSAEELYTFIHMFNYNDTINFDEMVL